MTRFLLLSDSCEFVDVALSLTRGQFYRLQLLLILASAVILGSESRQIRDHILLYQIRGFFKLFDIDYYYIGLVHRRSFSVPCLSSG
jgi:hypothetical protein